MLTVFSGLKRRGVLMDLRRPFAFIHSQAANHPNRSHCISPRPVQDILTGDPSEFYEYAQSSRAVPLRTRSPARADESMANELLSRLRDAEERIIEVEMGRYDEVVAGSFEKISMRLGHYLDWLESDESIGGKVSGRQLYLAQWRASDDIQGLADIIRPPTLLAPLMQNDHACIDLYQTSFFIGPAGAVTPLHYDPYFNLYQVYASSAPARYAKHVFLLPPHAREFVMRADGHHALQNTSLINLSLSPSQHGDSLNIVADPGTPSRSVDAISQLGYSCVLQEGETLFIPKGWWHRVENVVLGHSVGQTKPSGPGWTAAIGWWWLPRRRDISSS